MIVLWSQLRAYVDFPFRAMDKGNHFFHFLYRQRGNVIFLKLDNFVWRGPVPAMIVASLPLIVVVDI